MRSENFLIQKYFLVFPKLVYLVDLGLGITDFPLGKAEDKNGQPNNKASIIVNWSCLVPLLTKRQSAGCYSIVAEENMEMQHDGIKIEYCCYIICLMLRSYSRG